VIHGGPPIKVNLSPTNGLEIFTFKPVKKDIKSYLPNMCFKGNVISALIALPQNDLL
jgi:hypothetical protein